MLAGTAGIVAVSSGVAVNQVYNNGHLAWTWLAAAVTITVFWGVLAARLSGPASDEPVSAGAALDALAVSVERVWKPEQSRRRLLNPRPLPTAWTTIGPPIADHWANIRTDGVGTALDLDGVVDLNRPDALQRLITDPRIRGRVVLLGDPGAGKTALLIRLTLTLLQARAEQIREHPAADPPPVPVLLRLSTWNPQEHTLERWIAVRLQADYGARRPVATGSLLPLLDGLDEIPQTRRRAAMLAISRTFIDTPLILTSRTDEYLAALADLADHTLAAAAVLDLTALPAATVRAYLTLTTARPADWEEAFDRDGTEHDGRLGAALSAPLWVDLARSAYTDPDRSDNDPADLLLYPDVEAIREHLLDRLIPASYPDPPEPGPDGHSWQRSDAQRWLRFLATDMFHRDTQDLAWWDLALAVPPRVRLAYGLAGGLASGLLSGVAVGLAIATATGFQLGLMAGLFGGIGWGIMFGLAFGVRFELNAQPLPSRRDIRWRRSGRPLMLRIGLAVGGGLVGGSCIGFAGGFGLSCGAWMLRGPWDGRQIPFWVVIGLVFGLVAGPVFEFTTLLRNSDADLPTATDPRGLLRGDRRRAATVALGFAVVFTLGGGLVAQLASRLWAGPVRDFAGGLGVGLSFVLTFGLMVGFAFGSWGWLELARLWWCGHGRLPWPAMAFLSDAHRRGVLRQAGGVWQFRHALLRDRLANTATPLQSDDIAGVGQRVP